jgi:hypothetical protein
MIPAREAAGRSAMMGWQDRDQGQLFYEFSLDEMIPAGSHHGAGLVCALLFRSLCLTRGMVAFPVSSYSRLHADSCNKDAATSPEKAHCEFQLTQIMLIRVQADARRLREKNRSHPAMHRVKRSFA